MKAIFVSIDLLNAINFEFAKSYTYFYNYFLFLSLFRKQNETKTIKY